MIKIKTLTRYPFKSLSGESKNTLTVNDQGKIDLDRIAAFRIGNNSDYDGKWKSKINYLSLMHVPYLSLIQLTFDDKTKIISYQYREKKITNDILLESCFHIKLSLRSHNGLIDCLSHALHSHDADRM